MLARTVVLELGEGFAGGRRGTGRGESQRNVTAALQRSRRNTDAFEERNLTKAGYRSDPLTDGSLDRYKVYEIPMTTLTKDAVASLGRWVAGAIILGSALIAAALAFS